jgi:hypothetical protein
MCSARIPLTQGLCATVDEGDADALLAHKWHAHKAYRTFYAHRSASGSPRTILMHRQIIGAPEGTVVDHIDGDGLNNRRSNLRLCDGSANQQNRVYLTTNTSGYRGVTFHRVTGKWQAQIKCRGENHYLGLYETPRLAAHAYDSKARELYGSCARLNVPKEGA